MQRRSIVCRVVHSNSHTVSIAPPFHCYPWRCLLRVLHFLLYMYVIGNYAIKENLKIQYWKRRTFH